MAYQTLECDRRGGLAARERREELSDPVPVFCDPIEVDRSFLPVDQAPLGRPRSFPLALAAASPSLVRSEIRSRSTSANNPNRAIITLVGRSCLPSNSIASLMAMKRILRWTRVSTIWIT